MVIVNDPEGSFISLKNQHQREQQYSSSSSMIGYTSGNNDEYGTRRMND
jgi:hypothetical protein